MCARVYEHREAATVILVWGVMVGVCRAFSACKARIHSREHAVSETHHGAASLLPAIRREDGREGGDVGHVASKRATGEAVPLVPLLA